MIETGFALLKDVGLNLFTSFNGLILVAAVFIPFEKLFSIRPQKILRFQWKSDVVYYFLSRLISDFVLTIPFSFIILLCSFVPLDSTQAFFGGLPFAMKFALGLLIGEFGAYWGHRFLHEVPVLWKFHAIHHAAEEMDWLVNIRVHPVETIMLKTFQFVPLFALGLVSIGSDSSSLLLVLIPLVGALWGYFIHSNIRWRFGFLEWVITTPVFHHWHHTNDSPRLYNKNYAFVLPIYDYIFGSIHLPKKDFSKTFGIKEKVPTTFLGQLMYPFESSNKKRSKSKSLQIPASEGNPEPTPKSFLP